MADSKQNKEEYNPTAIEPKWQKYWEDNKIFSPDLVNAQNPYYTLMMFPYPSAEGLHVGNMYAFTGADVHARFIRMKGKDVFEPIGLDGFGIHSENYAIKVGRHPKEQAKISQKNFYRQLRATGNAYDWTRTVETYDPDYYRWTQWIFIQMFKKGLAYRKKAHINWCPSDKTVLADEQVINGKCERDGALVEKRDLEQWFFKITEYADALLNGLNQIDWPGKIKIAQRQWIGKSEGARINFPIDDKTSYVLLHGFTGSVDANFFSWLRRELEKGGKKVWAENLPKTNDPNINEQVDFVLKNANFDKNTVLLGHSLGSVVALKVVERLNKPIKKLVLAAGFMQPKFLDHSRPFEAKFNWQFDTKKIKQNVSEVVILRAKNDYAVPPERADYIKIQIGGEVIDFVAKEEHICGKIEPVVLENVAQSIEVFTTRMDTLFGATFMVLSPEHPLVASIKDKKVQDYVRAAKKKTDKERIEEGKEKTGIFSGLYAINPVNNEKIPVWIADYAVMGYGTGALFGDAHDERDVEFAKKYNIPLKPTLLTGDKKRDERIKNLEECFTGYGILFNSGEFSGLSSEDAKKNITAWLKKHNAGGPETTYHLRDWLISRQRYWGPPIPMIFCSTCEKNRQGERKDTPGWWTVPEDELPVLLPDVEDWRPRSSRSSSGQARVEGPLANHPEFYETTCPSCSSEARRETDVSDTFLDSSWYYLRYLSVGNQKSKIKNQKSGSKDIKKHQSLEIGSIGNLKFDEPYDIHTVRKWCPVAIYIGGAEHSVLHLLYVRFIAMVLHDLNSPLALPFQEPFPRFYAHGLLISQGAKMSKSRGNVIVPDDYIKKFGADTVRLYLMFLGPFDHGGDFLDTGIEGMHRFVRRVWTLLTKAQISNSKFQISNERLRMMHKTIKAVTEDIESFSYNTAIAKMMEWYNFLSEQLTTDHVQLAKEEAEMFLKLLAPFAPHLMEELWQSFYAQGRTLASIHFETWPQYEGKFLKEDQVTIVIQVNGKRRGEVTLDSSSIDKKEEVEALARKEVEKHVKDARVKKVINVPGKIINFVV